MATRDLVGRTREFALRVMRLYAKLPRSGAAAVIGHQLLRPGISVGEHYREGTRSRSTAELISKFQVALQELDESQYWLELLVDGGLVSGHRLEPLRREAKELAAIFTTCIVRAKERSNVRMEGR